MLKFANGMDVFNNVKDLEIVLDKTQKKFQRVWPKYKMEKNKWRLKNTTYMQTQHSK